MNIESYFDRSLLLSMKIAGNWKKGPPKEKRNGVLLGLLGKPFILFLFVFFFHPSF